MTPFFSGWMTRISGGVRPIIALASLPTAWIEWSSPRIATIEGSLTMMPSPWTKTRVSDVPRSIATSLENLRKNIRVGGRSGTRDQLAGRANGVDELGAGEWLVE